MRLASTLVAFVVTFVVGLSGPAFAQTKAAPPPASASAPETPPAAAATPPGVGETTSSAYVLGRDDVLSVSLIGRNDFGGSVRVQADGTIQLPLIGKIVAADRTTSDLSETIRKALQSGGFYADPIVNIEVSSFASRYVTVLGAVGTPGIVPLNRPYRLSEILARVGGVRDGAADYLVVRPTAGDEKHFVIRDLATGDTTQDPFVSAGDKIYAPVAEVFYIYGQVHSPGVYPLTAEMSVRMAIARGGGLTDSGSDKKVDVTRKGKKMTLDGGGKILAGDVLVINERLF
jgi:polysaccharide export outer membrane protein